MLKYVAPLRKQLRHLSARVPKREHANYTTGDQETTGQRLAEHVAAFIGSWRFIGAQAALMTVWVLLNTLQFTGVIHFDSYPFILLNLSMSAEAAFTGPLLLIAANVGAIRDHKQADKIEQLAWDNDKQGAEIQDTLAAHGQKLTGLCEEQSTMQEAIADMHALLTDLNARISPPVALGISNGIANANSLVAANQGTVTPPAPKRSHHKKVVAKP